MKGKKIEDAVVQAVLKAHENGVARRAIAEQYDISLRSVGRLLKTQTTKNGQSSQDDHQPNLDRMRRIEALEKRIIALEKKILNH